MRTINNSEHKARKEHTCDYCGVKIQVGEVYDYQFNVDGDSYTWKSHKKCTWLTRELKMHDDCYDGVSDQDFYEYIVQYFNDNVDEEFDSVKRTFQEKLDWTLEHLKNKTNGKSNK